MISSFQNSIIDYKNEMEKNKGNKILFKAKYIKFIDKIELVRKFYEYIKNNINKENEIKMWKYNIFNQDNIMKNILEIIPISDDTTTSKFNLLFLENLYFLDYKNNKNILHEKGNDINNKEQEQINNNNENENDDNEFIRNKNNFNNSNNKKDANENNENKDNENLYSKEQIQILKNIFINNNIINEYLINMNSKENLYLLNENLKLMNKIIQIINNIKNEDILPDDKYLLFTKYYSSINKQSLSNIVKVPNLLDDLLLFYYQITIPFINNEISNNEVFNNYLKIIRDILQWSFYIDEKGDKIQNDYILTIFGIEVIIKFFDIRLNIKEISIISNINNDNDSNLIYLNKEDMILHKKNINNIYNKFDFSIFDKFYEEVVKLLDNIDYQIFFLLEFILNMIVPEEKKTKLNSLIETININKVWIDNEEELFELYNFIKEKVINNKLINNQSNINNSDFIGINLDEENEKDDGYIEKDIIVDEVTDEDNDFENDNYNINDNEL